MVIVIMCSNTAKGGGSSIFFKVYDLSTTIYYFIKKSILYFINIFLKIECLSVCYAIYGHAFPLKFTTTDKRLNYRYFENILGNKRQILVLPFFLTPFANNLSHD